MFRRNSSASKESAKQNLCRSHIDCEAGSFLLIEVYIVIRKKSGRDLYDEFFFNRGAAKCKGHGKEVC